MNLSAPRHAGHRLLLIVVLLAGLGGLVLWWMRPWADTAMRVSIVASTDEGGSAVAYKGNALFSSKKAARPVLRAEINLEPWSGQLLLLEIRGTVSPRAVEQGAAGQIACSADLMRPDGSEPIEFASWQHGSELGLHVGPLGPTSCWVGHGEEQFAFAPQGDLWHVVRVPEGGRLRVSLRPVLPGDAPGRPQVVSPAGRAAGGHPYGGAGAGTGHGPDIFIYLIDALRADHLGCYGYTRATSPNIDSFAAAATLYEQAQTAATWTRPSVATLLTGLYPMVHGAMHESDALGEWPVLLPEMLQQDGYSTWCFVTNGNVAASLGFDQGYDTFTWLDRASAAWVNREVEDALAELDPGQPVFMYLHTIEPHDPYTPGPQSLARFDRGFAGRCDGSVEALEEVGCVRPQVSRDDVEHLIDLYDAEVFEADEGFGGFLTVLRRAGRYEEALIVLVSDHGEAFAEHNTLCHGWSLNQEEMRVPLMVRFPGGRNAGMRLADPTSLTDIVPAVLAEVGLAPQLDYRLPGQRLPRQAGREAVGERRTYAEVSIRPNNDHDLVGVIDEDGFKRVIDVSVLPRETAARESIGLWDTQADPTESNSLLESMPVRAAYGEQLLVQWLHEQRRWRETLDVAGPPPVELTDEMRKSLRALGYLR